MNRIVVGLVALLLSANAASYELLHFGFEDGQNPTAPSGYRFTGPMGGMNISGSPPVITSEISRSGSRSMKTQLNRLTSPVSYRMEATLNEVCSRFCFDHSRGAETQDYWIGFSVRMKDPYGKDAKLLYTQMIFQVHSSPPPGEDYPWDGGGWPIVIDARPRTDSSGVFRIIVGGGGIGSPEGPDQSYIRFNGEVGSYVTDQWLDFVIHAKWTNDAAGFMRIWIDGVKVVDITGPTYHTNMGPPYPKMGLYIAWKDRNMDDPVYEKTLYHDDFKIAWGDGAGYSTVAPGGSGSGGGEDPPPVKLPVMQNLRIEAPRF